MKISTLFREFSIKEDVTLETNTLNETTSKTPEELFKEFDLKIRSQIRTDFGTQYQFYRRLTNEEKEKLEQSNKVLYKNFYIFILF